MTQAPTPGPLSAEDWASLADLHTLKEWLHGVSLTPDWNDVVADGGVTVAMVVQQEAGQMASRVGRVIDNFRLAPTAPVEASGSEREHGPKCWGKTSISDEMMYCYCGSTDSPPGETREALDRLKMAAHVYEDDEMAADCATLEALLSARPLALGGQKGDSETLRVLLDNLVIAQTLSKDIRQKATDEARSYLYDLRHTPQPSGKTREAVARLEDRLNARRMKARDEARNLVPQGKRATWVEDSLSSAAVEVPYADLLALLSACPLTLGGQS